MSAARRKAKIREDAKTLPPAAEDTSEELVLNTPVRPTLREFSPPPAPPQGASPDDIVQAALARLARIVEVSRDRASTSAGADAHFGLRQNVVAEPGPTAEDPIAPPAEDTEDRTRAAVEGLAAKLRDIGLGEAAAPMPEVAIPAPAPPPPDPVAVEIPAPPPPLAAEAATPAPPAQAPMPAPAVPAAAKAEEPIVAELRSRLEAVERGLAQMQGHLRVTGERSREAIEEMGRKVVDFDQSLTAAQTTQRINTEAIEQLTGETSRVGRQVEERLERFDVGHAAVLETLGAEVARIDQAVEARLGQSEAAQAQSLASLRSEVARIDQAAEEASRLGKSLEDKVAKADAAHALDKLNDKITRISERLAERIAASDWRSAQAIEDVGERMTGASEQLLRRLDQTTADLMARVRLSEERAADIFKKAVDDIETLGRAASSPPPLAGPDRDRAFRAGEPEPLPHPDPIATPLTPLVEERLEISVPEAGESPLATPEPGEDWAMEPSSATGPQAPEPPKPTGKRPTPGPTFGKASVKEPAKDAFWNRIGIFKPS
jgi:hypothetical protein